MTALAFLAGVVVGIGAVFAVAYWMVSSRLRWEKRLVDARPFDDRRPEERR